MEEIIISGTSKAERYQELLPQIRALIEAEHDPIARMANICGAIREAFPFLWIGFYRVVDNRLILGPFQGPIACMSIRYGKGVCGTSWAEKRTIVVPDVEKFPGHIACSSASRSEIVVPVIKNGEVEALIDIDSADLNTFDSTDAIALEEVAKWLTEL